MHTGQNISMRAVKQGPFWHSSFPSKQCDHIYIWADKGLENRHQNSNVYISLNPSSHIFSSSLDDSSGIFRFDAGNNLNSSTTLVVRSKNSCCAQFLLLLFHQKPQMNPRFVLLESNFHETFVSSLLLVQIFF